MVKFIVAIDEPRVRFPVGAKKQQHPAVPKKKQSTPGEQSRREKDEKGGTAIFFAILGGKGARAGIRHRCVRLVPGRNECEVHRIDRVLAVRRRKDRE